MFDLGLKDKSPLFCDYHEGEKGNEIKHTTATSSLITAKGYQVVLVFDLGLEDKIPLFFCNYHEGA